MIGPVFPASRVAGAPRIKIPRPPSAEPPAGDRIVISADPRQLVERYTQLSRAQRDLFLVRQSVPTPTSTLKVKETKGATAAAPGAAVSKGSSPPQGPPSPAPALATLGTKVDILA